MVTANVAFLLIIVALLLKVLLGLLDLLFLLFSCGFCLCQQEASYWASVSLSALDSTSQ